MKRWHIKAICGALMLVAMLICFLLPIKLTVYFRRRGDNGQHYLDLLACFAGGVFLAAYLIFMAPAVRELIFVNLMVPNNIEYPLPDMLIGIGFFILLLLNRVVISMSKLKDSKKNSPRNAVVGANGNEIRAINAPENGTEERDTNLDYEGGDMTLRTDYVNGGLESSRNNTGTLLVDMGCTDKMTSGNRVSENGVQQFDGNVEIEIDDDLVFQPHTHSPYPLPRRSSIADVAHQDSMTRSIIMMLALSLDSVLEGVTTGLKTTIVEVWAIFIGNLVHETVIAFCLGLQLVRVHTHTRPVVIAAIAYSLMNPVGLVVATVIFESLEADPRIDLFNGLFQALTSGVFIYVTFCEILEGQITHRTSYTKILCMFSGFAVLAAFAAVPGSTSYSLAALMPCEHLSNVTTISPLSN